ncbi:MAG TPA: hypothetical protein PKE12_15660 [Kiritimatiellia bacterium]|nr:hypothetical protein [Kiritimatiellia bacterium]
MRLRLLVPLLAVPFAADPARAVEASPPRQVTLQIYDSGLTLVNELRSLVVPAGESPVVVRPLPARLDPASVSVTPTAGGRGLDVLEQRFEHDLADAGRLLRRYLERAVTVGSGAAAREGRLVGLPAWREAPYASEPLVLAQPDGSLLSFFSANDAGRVSFPGAASVAFAQPTLLWQARPAAEGQQNFRLGYLVEGLSWRAVYDVVLAAEATQAQLSGRVGIENRSGGRYEDASVMLVETERGRLVDTIADAFESPPHRYAYGIPVPRDERSVASLAPVQTHAIERKITLADGDTVYVPLASALQLPVDRIFVYDGVRFDRFQRNRRNDWNYGTEYHTTVDTHLEFENTGSAGLGVHLPPGRLRLYQQRADGAVDLLGEDALASVASGARGQVRVGPARGLRGERERTGYTEVRPLREYEESFEIRLSNDSDQAAVIRVVEHLYRWSEYEIVKSDAEYKVTGPQTIEFRPELKPGGRRAIHYTVRYRW